MSVIATAVKYLLAAGVTGDELVAAIAEMEDSMPARDPVADRRRAYDRERKRIAKENRSTGIPPDSTETVETVPALLSPQTPLSTHPREENPRARKKTRFSDSWRPETLTTGKSGEAAKRRGQEWLKTEFEKFGNYFRAEGTTKLDWQGTWANWVISSDERQALPRGQPPTSNNPLYEHAKQYAAQ
jgi:hypothetical protein